MQIYKVDPFIGNDGLRGVISLATCEVKQNSALFPSFDKDFREIGGFYKSSGNSQPCEIIPGNSGSAVIDSKGNVRAIAQAYEALLNRSMYFATNMACIPTPFDSAGRTFSDQCPMDLSLYNNLDPVLNPRDHKDSKKELVDEVNQAVSAWGNSQFPFFKWTFAQIDTADFVSRMFGFNKKYYIPFPKCVKPDAPGLTEYRHLFFYYSDVEKDLGFPMYMSAGEGLSDDLSKLKFNIIPTYQDFNARIEFSTSDINRDKRAFVKITVPGKVYGRNTVLQAETPVCGEND